MAIREISRTSQILRELRKKPQTPEEKILQEQREKEDLRIVLETNKELQIFHEESRRKLVRSEMSARNAFVD